MIKPIILLSTLLLLLYCCHEKYWRTINIVNLITYINLTIYNSLILY